MNKKATTPIAIVILVIGTIVLVTTGLFLFMTVGRSPQAVIGNAKFVQDLYTKERLANFYLSIGIDSSVLNSYIDGVTSDGKTVYIKEASGLEEGKPGLVYQFEIP